MKLKNILIGAVIGFISAYILIIFLVILFFSFWYLFGIASSIFKFMILKIFGVLISGFLVGWGIHSLIRRLRK